MAPWPGDNWDTDRNRPASGVRYGVLFGILALVFLLILAMWFHARQRIRRGQGPMAYHRVYIHSLPTIFITLISNSLVVARIPPTSIPAPDATAATPAYAHERF